MSISILKYSNYGCPTPFFKKLIISANICLLPSSCEFNSLMIFFFFQVNSVGGVIHFFPFLKRNGFNFEAKGFLVLWNLE